MGVDDAADIGPRSHDVEMKPPFGRRLERPLPRSIFALDAASPRSCRGSATSYGVADGEISMVSPWRAEMLPEVPWFRPGGVHPAALVDDGFAQLKFGVGHVQLLTVQQRC